MPDTVLDVVDRTVSNTDKNLDLIGLHSSRVVGRRDTLKTRKLCYMLDDGKSCEEKTGWAGGGSWGAKRGHM